MRLVVTGRNGQVAQALGALAGEKLDIVFAALPDLDLSRPASVGPAIDALAPFDAVVSAAAWTAVDDAEANPDAALRVNRDGAAAVAAVAARHEVPVLHISTDHVFSGDKPTPYIETDEPGPVNIYGASKLAGEAAVLAANRRAIVLRTSWVWSTLGKNFARTMLALGAERDTVKVVADQVGAPNYAPDLARAIATVAQIATTGQWRAHLGGVFHLSAQETMSWHGFAEAIFATSARHGGHRANVEPVATEGFPRPARRPANSRLDAAKLATVYDIRLRGATAALDEAMPALLGGIGKGA
ncbi:MAG: dTDP-4-dehydrorhamnose reductase [Rhizobiaceae bacterium]